LIRFNGDAVLAKVWSNNRSMRRSWLSIRWFIFWARWSAGWPVLHRSVALRFYIIFRASRC